MSNRVLAMIVFVALIALPVLVALTGKTPQAPPLLVATAAPTATVPAQAPAELTPEATETSAPTAEAAVAEVADAGLIGDAASGDDIFHHGLNGAPACINCHSTTISGKAPLAVGPGLLGISERAATRVDGETAAQYVEDSIRHPDHYVVKGFNNVMYANFDHDYSAQNIADLVAYVLTL